MRSRARVLAVAIALPVLFASAVGLQRVMEARYPQFRVRPNDAFYLPRGDLLRATSLGFRQLTADLMWLRVVQAVGDFETRDEGYKFLSEYVELVTDIDERNAPAYFIASHWLTAWGETDEAIAVLEKGRERFRDKGLRSYYKFPYYIGLDYFLWKRDRETAIRYLKEAAELASHQHLASAAVLGRVTEAATDDRRMSYQQILSDLGALASSPGERAALEPLMRHGYFYDMVQQLEPAVQRYRERFGKWPDDLGALVELGWLTRVPEDPYADIVRLGQPTGLFVDDEGHVRSRARPGYWWEPDDPRWQPKPRRRRRMEAEPS